MHIIKVLIEVKGEEEEESLTYLLKCPTPPSELLCEEALVNADLSLTEPRGNSRSDFDLVSLRRITRV